MITAKELMHKGAPVIAFDQTVEDAVHFLRNSPLNFVAVSASQDRFHGVLTEACLMRIYLRYQANPTKKTLILYRDLFEPTQLIHEKEPFAEIVKKLVTAVGNRVFVINDKSEVVGYITAKDILPVFSGIKDSQDKSNAPAMPQVSMDPQIYLYENFFTKSPFMMHSANSHGIIQMANEILHAVLGYEYGELLGKTIFDLYSKEQHKKAEQGLQTILDKGYHKVIQSQMIHKSGHSINVELVSRALEDHNGNPIGTITVSRPMEMEYLLKVLPHLE